MDIGDGTRAVHAGQPAPVPGQPFAAGPIFAAPYHLDPDTGPVAGVDSYGRTDNPTWRALETAIADLEGAAECVTFASGMAAVAAVAFITLRAGDTVVLPADGYYKSRAFVANRLKPFDVRVREVPTADADVDYAGARLVVVETPANPGLDVRDIAAHAAGALLAVDNTAATPLGQRPLSLGADLSFGAATKALAGHSDAVLGYVCVDDPALAEDLRGWRGEAGSIPGAFEAWLVHRSLATLDLRLHRQSATALAVATMLAGRPDVGSVRFPGLASDPGYEIASRQMRRIPGIVTFTLPSAARVAAFLKHSTLVAAATSFGGVHTSADRRAQWGDPVPEGLVRLSCGIEDPADLLADISAALDAAAA
jgi:cystathionine gamma-lyase